MDNKISIAQAKQCPDSRDAFIAIHKNFVAKVSSRICKRSLRWENDDELSEALIAFSDAIDQFDENKGDFLPFAALIIRRRLIDYFRRQSSRKKHVFLQSKRSNDSFNQSTWEAEQAHTKHQLEIERQRRVEEIQTLSQRLILYGISFTELTSNSPTHRSTRNNLLRAAIEVSKCHNVLERLRHTKRLPLRQLTKTTGLSRKVLKSWRKYFISLILIAVSDDLPILQSFIGIDRGSVDE